MCIDRMDAQGMIAPTIWAELNTQFFRNGARLLAAVNGSMWSGTKHTYIHIRTVFEDTPGDSEMQMSTVLLGLRHRQGEGHAQGTHGGASLVR